MERFFLFFIFYTIFFTKIYAEFNPLIQKQLPLMHQKDEHNITHDEMIKITQKQ